MKLRLDQQVDTGRVCKGRFYKCQESPSSLFSGVFQVKVERRTRGVNDINVKNVRDRSSLSKGISKNDQTKTKWLTTFLPSLEGPAN